MYEWENDIKKSAVTLRIHALRSEIKRVADTTLRGDFVCSDDRKYWERKLKKMNSELSCLEQLEKVTK